MFNILELFDFLAICNIHLSNYFKIKHNAAGWLLSSCSILYFIFRAYSLNLTAQTLGHILSLSMALTGFYHWRYNK